MNQDNYFEKAMVNASKNGQLSIIETLFDQSLIVNIDFIDDCKMTALMYAASNGSLDIVKFLVSKGVNLNLRDAYDFTALMNATLYNKFEITKFLVDKGANLDFVNWNRNSALMIAIINDCTEIAIFLINKGANLVLKNIYGNTALRLAIKTDNTTLVGIIESVMDKKIENTVVDAPVINKIDIENAMDKKIENTVVDVPVINKIDIENAMMDASKNGELDRKMTAFMWAVSKGHLDIVEFLVDKGVNLNLTDNDGNSPLIIATCNGFIEITKLLIDKGANLDLTDKRGNSPLIIATYYSRAEIAKLLINKGANIDLVNSNGRSALMIAAYIGNTIISKLLVDKGADIDLVDKNWETVWDKVGRNRVPETEYIIRNAMRKKFEIRKVVHKKVEIKSQHFSFPVNAKPVSLNINNENSEYICTDINGKEYPNLNPSTELTKIIYLVAKGTPVPETITGIIKSNSCQGKLWMGKKWIERTFTRNAHTEIQIPKDKNIKAEYHVSPDEKSYVKYPSDLKILVNGENTTLGDIYRF